MRERHRQENPIMPMELQIIRAAEFVRVGAQGQFDLAASKAALATVAGACRKRGIQQALMDLRALQPGPKPVFTPADLLELVKTFPEVGFTRRLRLAILYRSDPHKRARLFAFLSTLHGWSVRAFGDFEEALSWLSSGPVPPTPSSGEKSIPIPISNREAKAPALVGPPPVRPEDRPGGSECAGSRTRRTGRRAGRPVHSRVKSR
jgi:hypothetical protein